MICLHSECKLHIISCWIPTLIAPKLLVHALHSDKHSSIVPFSPPSTNVLFDKMPCIRINILLLCPFPHRPQTYSLIRCLMCSNHSRNYYPHLQIRKEITFPNSGPTKISTSVSVCMHNEKSFKTYDHIAISVNDTRE